MEDNANKMRPRRATKAKHISYAEANAPNSDDSAAEENAVEAYKDKQTGATTLGQNHKPADIEEPAQDHQMPDTGVAVGHQNADLLNSGDESDTSSFDDVPRGKFGIKLPRRTAIHAVPLYLTDTSKTRVYDGPLKRETSGRALLKQLYGPLPDHVTVIQGMVDRWFSKQALPDGQIGGSGVMQSPWLAADFEEKQRHWSNTWYARYRGAIEAPQRLRKIRTDHVNMFKPPSNELACLVGPYGTQKQAKTAYGYGEPTSETGVPLDSTASPTAPKSWLLDTGGIPLGIAWAPLAGRKEQFLAVCSIPFTDQDARDADSPEDDPEEMKKGSVQIWSIPCHKDVASPARFALSLSFDWGRPKRLQWCPIPPPEDSKIGLLAVLCGDGQVRVIEVPKPVPGQDEIYEWVTSPIATVGLRDEYAVHATALTWVNINRLCIGHSDGTVTLWSICPQHLVARRSIHTNPILDITSGFPSHPYHITTVPVGGSPTLTDLALPSAETTSIFVPSCVNMQHNLLNWNDHLQGYFHMHPSADPNNTVVGWAHIRYFVQSRIVLTTASPPTCISSGHTHPFTLVGCADGSVWSINPLRSLLRKARSEPTYKLQILQHEFRPVKNTPRGVARLLQGFRPEFNANPRVDILELERFMNATQKNARGKRKGKPKNDAEPDGPLGVDGLTVSDEVSLQKSINMTKAVVHEPLTRVTMAAWNPNVEYGWWAAVAMASGLVKVMDLGVGRLQGHT